MVAMGDDNRKKIRFLYYRLFVSRKENGKRTRKLFDLSEWSTEVMQSIPNIENRNIEFGGDTIRLQKQWINEEELVELQFNRLSVTNTSYIAKDDSDVEENFKLESNEYPAQDTCIIFDPKYCVVMLQRNSQGLSLRGISDYINHYWNLNRSKDEEEYVEFEPVVEKDVFAEAKRSNRYKTLTIKTANKFDNKRNVLNRVSDAFRGPLEKVLDEAEPLGGLNIEITFSAGRSKNRTLNDDEVRNLLGQIEEHPSALSKASVGFLDDNDKTEMLNLLKATVSDFYEFNLPKKSRLNPNVVFNEMRSIYLGNENNGGRRSDIIRMIR